jgi:hypothetical protein
LGVEVRVRLRLRLRARGGFRVAVVIPARPQPAPSSSTRLPRTLSWASVARKMLSATLASHTQCPRLPSCNRK